MIKVNHNQASDFSPLAAGPYECFVEAGAVKTTSAGSPMINWKLKVRSDIPGQAGGGRVIFDNLVIQDNTMGMVQGFLKAINAPDGMEFPDAASLRDFAVGRPIVAVLKISEWNGNERNEVNYYKLSEAGGGSTATPDPFGGTQQTQRMDNDPFAASNNKGPITVNEDDLPF